MLLILAGPVIAVVAVAVTFFLTDRSHWRKFLLIVGIIAAALSGLQAYRSRERVNDLQRQVATAEQKLKPRTITPEQKEVLLACFATGPKGPVTVIPKTFDNEAEDYAAKIVDVLQSGDFEIRPHEGPRPFGFGQSGIFAVFKDAAHIPAHAGTIQYCLKQIDVELAGGANPDWVKDDPNLVVIAVGQKP
jgi:hypothetical protein